ncbi:hypothetical protein [Asticcacaulis taihuensis]|uniref:Uncharacterized protein n=1 Tax=Asticcacaulis taihuensis TaxID=260084 RepID=A0A1G4T3L4_9CAUL|nr:hypothetical protein [Asticcacaulis taihuensis]SCW75901.1 hypothetical protein SAMN02927928_3218 [Asticcacaulis taihuensis]
MSHRPVHYELFSRRTPQSSWVLEMASESRDQVVAAADEMLKSGRAAVRVTKEMLDPDSGEYSSVTVLDKGVAVAAKKPKLAPTTDTVCTSPQDLYSALAREKISRLLEDWLKLQGVTAFELLHRPDLAERLEASGSELLHVVQKLAVPESHETGQALHDLMRRWTGLFDKACTRLIQDGRKGLFPELTPENCLEVVDRLHDHPERAYVFGGALAATLKGQRRPSVKLETLLIHAGLINAWLDAHPEREWALQLIEIPVVELFAARGSLNDVLGEEMDLGGAMMIMTRLAAGREVDLIARADARVARLTPPLSGVLGGYHDLILNSRLPHLSYHISKRLMQELKSPRRLRPNDPMGEIEILRVLALCMTAAGRDESQRDDITEAFADRSRKLVSADFITNLLETAETPAEEADRLIWLCENMVGAANKRQAARWLSQIVGADKFERHMRESQQSAAQRLLSLAQMQGRVAAAALIDQDGEEVTRRLGLIGNQIATDVKLLAHIQRGGASPMQKFSMLLSFAAGQSAPFGPLSEQAKAEVMKMMRDPALRSGLSAQPQILATLRPMMQAAGVLAA